MIKGGSKRVVLVLVVLAMLLALPFLIDLDEDSPSSGKLSLSHKELDVVFYGDSISSIDIPPEIRREIAKKTDKLVFVLKQHDSSIVGGAVGETVPVIAVQKGTSTTVDLDGDGVADLRVTVNNIFEDGKIDATFKLLGEGLEIKEGIVLEQLTQCTDSDLEDSFQKGVVTAPLLPQDLVDSCKDESTLLEGVCSGGNYILGDTIDSNVKEIPCEFGCAGGVCNTEEVDTQDLVAHWSFDNDASDSSGNNVDGLLGSGAKIIDGGVYLDGIDDFVLVPDHPALNKLEKEVTISAWVKMKSKTGVIFDGYSNHGNTKGFGLWTHTIDDEESASFSALNDRKKIFVLAPFDSEKRVFITGVYDGKTRKIYINGELKETNEQLGSINDQGFDRRIGGQVKNPKRPERFFGGYIYDLKIYNSAHSDEEISKEFESGVARILPIEKETPKEVYSLIGHWDFENDASDSSGNGVHGVLKGDAKIVDGSVVLDGVDDYVEIPDHKALNDISHSVTVSAWVKPTKAGVIFDGYRDHGNSFGFGLWTHLIEGSDATSFSALRTSPPHVLTHFDNSGELVMITGVYDGKTRKIYVDGKLEGTNTLKGVIKERGFPRRIGSQVKKGKQNVRFFGGSIDEVKIWDIALTEEEVKKEFDSKFKVVEDIVALSLDVKLDKVGAKVKKLFTVEDSVIDITGVADIGDHTITFLGVQDGKAIFEILSDPIIFVGDVGDTNKFDMNRDGFYDLQLTIIAINDDGTVEMESTILPNTEPISDVVAEEEAECTVESGVSIGCESNQECISNECVDTQIVQVLPLKEVGQKLTISLGEGFKQLTITDLPEVGNHMISYEDYNPETDEVIFIIQNQETGTEQIVTIVVGSDNTVELDLNGDIISDILMTVHTISGDYANTVIELMAQETLELAECTDPEGTTTTCTATQQCVVGSCFENALVKEVTLTAVEQAVSLVSVGSGEGVEFLKIVDLPGDLDYFMAYTSGVGGQEGAQESVQEDLENSFILADENGENEQILEVEDGRVDIDLDSDGVFDITLTLEATSTYGRADIKLALYEPIESLECIGLNGGKSICTIGRQCVVGACVKEEAISSVALSEVGQKESVSFDKAATEKRIVKIIDIPILGDYFVFYKGNNILTGELTFVLENDVGERQTFVITSDEPAKLDLDGDDIPNILFDVEDVQFGKATVSATLLSSEGKVEKALPRYSLPSVGDSEDVTFTSEEPSIRLVDLPFDLKEATVTFQDGKFLVKGDTVNAKQLVYLSDQTVEVDLDYDSIKDMSMTLKGLVDGNPQVTFTALEQIEGVECTVENDITLGCIPFHECIEGACVPSTNLDYDGDACFYLEKPPYNSGKTVVRTLVAGEWQPEQVSTCVDGATVNWLKCSGTTTLEIPFPCRGGATCFDGGCGIEEEPSCTDNDGDDRLVKDKISYVEQYAKGEKEDKCHNSKKLVEQTCIDGKRAKTEYTCNCVEGACTDDDYTSCVDPDGSDKLVKSSLIVTVNGKRQTDYEFEDSCDDEGRLIEAVCNGGPNFRSDFCPQGNVCQDGACVKSELICDDSDGGDIYKKGYVEFGGGSQLFTDFDQCNGPNAIREQVCRDGKKVTLNFPCNCVRGACVPEGVEAGEPTCSDPDADTENKGRNVKGIVEYSDFSGDIVVEDYCINPGILAEYACYADGSLQAGGSTSCPCEDGACVGTRTTCEDPDGLDIYAKNEVDYYTRDTGSLVKQPGNVDTCSAGKVREFYCEDSKTPPKFKDIGCPDGQACVDGACALAPKGLSPNELSRALESQHKRLYGPLSGGSGVPPWVTTTQTLTGQSIGIQIGPRPTSNLLCDDDDDEDFENAGKVIFLNQTYKDVCNADVRGNVLNTDYTVNAVAEKICVNDELRILFEECDGTCRNGECVPGLGIVPLSFNEFQCVDPDGNDYYNAGEVSYTNHPDVLEKHDSCDGDTVIERLCVSNIDDDLNFERFECPAGCKSGACVKACDDPDGDNITEANSVTRHRAGKPTEQYLDKCVTKIVNGKIVSDTVKENICNGNFPDVLVKKCAEGSTCMAGACVELKQFPCTDTDDGPDDIFNKGHTNVKGAVPPLREDRCEGNTLYEGACGEPNHEKIVTCDYACSAGACIDPSTVECFDEDGGDDPSIASNTFHLKIGGQLSAQGKETCFQGGLAIREFYCTEDNKLKNRVHFCDFQEEKCVEGACVSKNPFFCTDSDGPDKDVKGVTNDIPDTCADKTQYGYEAAEECSGEECYVVEQVCALITTRPTYQKCDFGCSDGACLPELTTQQLSCVETDGGEFDYTAKGSVYLEREHEIDTCLSDNEPAETGIKLRENYCYGGDLAFTDIDCLFGCQDGACVYSDPASGFCEDSDAGINVYSAGSVSQEGFETKRDTCVDPLKLSEATCDYSSANEDKGAVKLIHCAAGCIDGACFVDVTKDSCEDTDGGKDFLIKGTAKHSSGASISDSCDSETTVREAFCVRSGTGTSYVTSIPVDCLHGCFEGKCRIEPKPPVEIVSATITPKRGTENTIFTLEVEIIGDQPVSSPQADIYFDSTLINRQSPSDDGGGRDDRIKGDNIYTSKISAKGYVGQGSNRREHTEIGEHRIDLRVFSEETSNWESFENIVTFVVFEPDNCYDTDEGKNIFVQGNADVKGATGVEDTCYELRGQTYNPRLSCTHDCYVDEGFCQADKFAPQLERIRCPGSCVNGACVLTDKICEAPGLYDIHTPRTIIHSDGEFQDYCIDENTLSKGYCSFISLLETREVTCSKGCVAGRCLSDSRYCGADTDGKDPFVAGGVNDWPERCMQKTRGLPNFRDSCSGDNCYVNELWCENEEGIRSEQMRCEYACVGGACISEAEELCIDPDRFDIDLSANPTEWSVPARIQRKTIGQIIKDGEVIDELADECLEKFKVNEVYCSDNQLRYGNWECGEDQICAEGACIEDACADDDVGDDPHVFGTVTKGRTERLDKCVDGKLHQYFCEVDGISERINDCAYVCREGVCLDSPPVCVDVDLEDKFTNSSALLLGSGLELDIKYDECFEDGVKEDVLGNIVPIWKVNEAVCVDDELAYKPIVCDNGCSNGACRKPQTLFSPILAGCYGSQGIDKFEKETVTHSLLQDEKSDYCDGDILMEAECDGSNPIKFEEINCLEGCTDGVCNPEPKCNDPKLWNPFEKETVTFGIGSNIENAERDYCDGDSLYEAVCKGTEEGVRDIAHVPITCANGCSDGACVSDSDTVGAAIFGAQVTYLPSECNEFYNEEDIFTDSGEHCIIKDTDSDNQDYVDLCSGGNCLVEEKVCRDVEVEVFGREGNYRRLERGLKHILCPDGYSCRRGACVEGVEEYVVVIEERTVEVSCSADQTIDECTAQDYYTELSCPDDFVPSGIWSTDILEHNNGPFVQIISIDTTVSGSAVREHYIMHPNLARKAQADGKTYFLKGRRSMRCVKKTPDLTCEDDDGGNDLFTEGSATLKKGNKDIFKLGDGCVNIIGREAQIVETYCDAGELAKGIRTCPQHSQCVSGACVALGDLCFDSDVGRKPLVQGDTYIPGIGSPVSDTCFENGNSEEECAGDACFVKENFCNEEGPKDELIKCDHGCKKGACLFELPIGLRTVTGTVSVNEEVDPVVYSIKVAEPNKKVISETLDYEEDCGLDECEGYIKNEMHCPSGFEIIDNSHKDIANLGFADAQVFVQGDLVFNRVTWLYDLIQSGRMRLKAEHTIECREVGSTDIETPEYTVLQTETTEKLDRYIGKEITADVIVLASGYGVELLSINK
jgi:hypothetical protein